jgi:hypothetical protein
LDSIGAVVPGAKVVVTNNAAKNSWQTATNDEGQFEFGPVPAGDYSIAISLPGFKSFELKNVNVEDDQLLNLGIILEPGYATETVGVVMAEPSLIETPPGTTIFSEQMIRRLPIPK